MRPAFLDAMSWEMAEVYGAVTDQILINLAHYFPYYDSRNFPRSSITYQADMLAQMGQVNRETVAIIRRNLVGASPALKRCLEQVIIDSVQAVNPSLAAAVKKGIFKPPTMPVVAPNQMRAFNLYYQQAANKLNLVNTVMLESTQQAYQATVADIVNRIQATQTAIDIGAGEVVTGVSSWNQATAHAIDRLKRDGITGFIDHGGHRWSAEAYVAMDVRTTMFNTGRAAIWETNQNFGNDLYQVSYHDGARPLCYPWQNKVISSTDNERIVADLDGYEVHVYPQSATSYGEAAGLFGVNCKHYPTPFIPGVSIIRGEPQSEEENAKSYEESQQQRKLERTLREEKRDLMMLKAQGAPHEIIKAQQDRVRQRSAEIQDFCDQTGRARHRDREGIYTERKFPSAKTYDVAAFEEKQKQMIEGFYSVGGAQVEYNNVSGMVPNVPIVPQPRPVTVAPAVSAPQATPQPATQDVVAQAIGVQQGQPLTVEKAAKGANPDFHIDVQNQVNCQRCVQAYELRRRGYDVEAMPKPKRNNGVSWGSECFGDYGQSRAKAIAAYTLNQTEEQVKKELANAPEGARYSIYIRWRSARSAHVFIAEKTGGVVKFVDPQTGDMDASGYFARGSKGKFGFFRMDDKPLTTDAAIIAQTVRKGR